PSFFYSSIRPPQSSTLFPTRRSSDLTARTRHSAAHLHRIERGAGGDTLMRTAVIAGNDVGDVRSMSAIARRCNDGRSAVNRIRIDRKSTRLNSSHVAISYAVFCLKKK